MSAPNEILGTREPGKVRPIDAPSLLEAAHGHMLERAAAYDQPGGERSVPAIVTAFNAITGRDDLNGLSEAEGWLFLQLLKQVRLFSAPGFHRDSAEDNVAYAALLGEAKAREVDPAGEATP